MNFIFVTRCYKPTNLQYVKKSIADVFYGTEHTYEHIIIVDMSYGTPYQIFKQYNDEHTTVFYAPTKYDNDEWMSDWVDKIIQHVGSPQDYVFILDDDNRLHPNFLGVVDECDGSDVIVFKIEGRPNLGNKELMYASSPVGYIDWANFITKVAAMREFHIYHGGKSGVCEDSLFFLKMKTHGCSFKFVDSVFAFYNALPRP